MATATDNAPQAHYRVAQTALVRQSDLADVVALVHIKLTFFGEGKDLQVSSAYLVMTIPVVIHDGDSALWRTILMEWSHNGYTIQSVHENAIGSRSQSLITQPYCACENCHTKASNLLGFLLMDSSITLDTIEAIIYDAAHDRMTSIATVIKNLTTPSVN